MLLASSLTCLIYFFDNRRNQKNVYSPIDSAELDKHSQHLLLKNTRKGVQLLYFYLDRWPANGAQTAPNGDPPRHLHGSGIDVLQEALHPIKPNRPPLPTQINDNRLRNRHLFPSLSELPVYASV